MSFSDEIAGIIRNETFSGHSATVIGYGNMGREYVKALQWLGVSQITVCSRSPGRLEELKNVKSMRLVSGGYQQLDARSKEEEIAIIAVPISELIPAALFLKELGFRKFLIEKPLSLYSKELEVFLEKFETRGMEVFCAYNRAAYPSLLEAEDLCRKEGGITSCTYTFTEMIRDNWTELFSAEELSRWGIANSLHVMSMAHRLIGLPKEWKAYQGGNAVAWHPAGSFFVGAGFSEKGIPFSYHADWTSKGRWSVEVHTGVSSYRFCPLEKLLQKKSALGEWEEAPVKCFSNDVKVGFVEQVAAMLNRTVRTKIPLVSLREALLLTRFGEDVFGYSSHSIASR